MPNLPKISPNDIKNYLDGILKTSSTSTYERKLSSLRKFFSWAKTQGYFQENAVEDYLNQQQGQIISKVVKAEKENFQSTPSQPFYSSVQAKLISKFEGKPRLQKFLYKAFYQRPEWYKTYHSISFTRYIHFAVLTIFSVGLVLGIYDQFRQKTTPVAAYPTSLVTPKRYLSFQGRLTNQYGNPVTDATDIVFKLWDHATNDTEVTCNGGGDENCLWSTQTCSVDPDDDGIFNVLLGTTSGNDFTCASATEITSDVFSENAEVWLGVKVDTDDEATPRIQIATVAYALNAETLQGFPIDATGSATKNTVVTMNDGGEIVIGETAPKIKSVSGNFLIQGQTMTLATPDTSNGSININPDGTGTLNLTFEGAAAGGGAGGFINATNTNITSTALYYGLVASDASGYDFIQFQSGSSPTEKFAVDSSGNTQMAGNLTVSGADIIGANGESINIGGTDATFLLKRNDTGTVTLTSTDNDSTAALTILPGGAAALTLGGASTTAINLTTDGTGNAEVILPNDSVGVAEIDDNGATPTDEYCLTYEETGGIFEWQTCGSGGGTNYWQITDEVIAPYNTTLDLAIGGTATASAKFIVNADTGNIITAGDLALDGGNITSTGALTITPNAGDNLNIALSGTGDLAVNTNQLYVDTSEGFVGIGLTDPSTLLHVTGSIFTGNFDATDAVASFVNTTNNDGIGVYGESASTDYYGYGGVFKGGYIGALGSVEPTGSEYYVGLMGTVEGGTGSNVGIEGWVLNGDTAFGGIFSSLGEAGEGDTINMTAVYGTSNNVRVSAYYDGASANINNAYGTYTSVTGELAYGATLSNIENAYGLYVAGSSVTGGATIEDNYGIYIGNQTVGSSSNYSIYSAGGANYFGGNITTAGDLYLNGDDLISDGTDFNITIADTGTFDFISGANTLMTLSDQGSTGRLAISDSLQVGSLSTTAYSRFGTDTSGHTGSGDIENTSDVLISDDLELNGTLFLDSGIITNSAGTTTISLSATPTTGFNTLTASSWLIENSANVGLAALTVNQMKAGDIFTASASGQTKFTIHNDGSITLAGLTSTTNTQEGTIYYDTDIDKIYLRTGNYTPPTLTSSTFGIIDSFSETNYSSNVWQLNADDGQPKFIGQSFTNPYTTKLDSAKFYLMKTGSPTGYAYAKIYAQTGTFGTSTDSPIGSVLATSDAFDVSTLTGSMSLITFNFSGSNRITLNASTNYFVLVYYNDGDTSNMVYVGTDASSPADDGVFIRSNSTGDPATWIYHASYDIIYYVYGGLNDLHTGGTYTGNTDLNYKVEIDGTGSPDTFKWSDDGGSTWDATTVAITGSAQTLNNGLTITFESSTGHTSGSSWTFTASATNSWARLATDMTKYSSTSANILNQSYVEIAHNQNTNDLTLTGWFYDTVTSLWKKISDWTSLISHDLDNEFNPEFTQKKKTTAVALNYNENDLGNGADGAITITGNTNINTIDSISGRSCSQGGDAINYNVLSFPAQNQAKLYPIPDGSCLSSGDELLLINQRGTSSAYTNVGNYETVRISSISGDTITFTTNKSNYYGDNANDDSNIASASGQIVMAQRVPNYTNVTVNATYNFYPEDFGTSHVPGDNGLRGGVMFFRASGAVSINGNIIADGTGYRGGIGGDAAASAYGGRGGESFCALEGGGTARTSQNSDNGVCGGGGGGSVHADVDYDGGDGSASLGGAGGGGGYASDGTSTASHDHGGGGGGGGYGTFGKGGESVQGAAYWGEDGGTSTSGDGGDAYQASTTNVRAGGAGGGGTFADDNTDLEKLHFGSAGGGGGNAEGSDGGAGGDGGGIVYIAANSITVSGTTSSDGNNGADGANGTYHHAGGGGAGAGGSIKLIGNTVNVGSSVTTASGGIGGIGPSTNDGGIGGKGRIAVYSSSPASGTSDPALDQNTLTFNTYTVFTGEEIHTPGTTAFNTISWTEDLDTSGEIQVQTRSGATSDSTDGTWEDWKPDTATTNELSINTFNTHTDWTGTRVTVADGEVARNIDYFEDEDEFTVGNATKIYSVGSSDGYVERDLGAGNEIDLSGYDYLSMWVYSTRSGNVLKLGFGESVATEQEETIGIDALNTWQKVYWDISDVAAASRNAARYFRISLTTTNTTAYLDNLIAATYPTTSGGSTISSTANEYIQYRFIISTTDTTKQPDISGISINLDNVDNPDGIDIDADRIRTIQDPYYSQTERAIVTEIDLDDYKSINTETSLTSIDQRGNYDPGTGADGDITVTGDTSINDVNLIAGRSCDDGGDAVNYNILSFPTQTSAQIEKSPSSGCLNIGDEILLINLRGTQSAYGNVGNYETLRISNISGDVITFATAKKNFYGDNIGDDTNVGVDTTSQIVMLQRVPNYEDITVNASVSFYPDNWIKPDNTTDDGPGEGGVMFFRATGSVAINGNITTTGRGYSGGDGGDVDIALYGGDGGETFCNEDGGADGGSLGNGNDGICGGGGGGAVNSDGVYTGGTGSASLGGAGGGGGYASDGTSTASHDYGGGGGGGGGGTYGTGGGALAEATDGDNGGISTSGNGGNGSEANTTSVRAGGGGGGGSFADDNTDLEKLHFGSGGGGGGNAETSDGGAGGDGGGIVYIAANSITVSGTIASNGNDGNAVTDTTYHHPAGGGGGAGGSVLLMGNSINVGSSLTTTSGGSGGSNNARVDQTGGAGGDGRVAVYYIDSFAGTIGDTGSSSTAYTSYYNYSVFISDEINTPNATAYNKIRWTENLDQYGMIQFQTRSGKSNNSTDGTWEDWKPVVNNTNVESLSNADTHTDWTGTNVTVADNSSVTRNVNYYEDEDEATVGDITQIYSVGSSDGYAEDTISSTDLSNFDYLTAWVYSTRSGNIVKMGFGESAATEQTKTFHIDSVNTWQKLYWDISDIDQSERNAVTKLRFSILNTNTTIYIDNVTADRYLKESSGSTISSTPNEYIQYRAILTSSNSAYRPKIHNVQVEWNNGFKIVQTDANTVRLYNFTGDTQQLRLDAIVFGADLAEWYTVEDQTIEPGDLVAITGQMDEFGVPILRKSNSINDPNLLGVISTKAGNTLGIEAENRRLLALAGRVPAKIDPSSAEIKAGDYLTSSSQAGYARKATSEDITIGRAFENWHPSMGRNTILVYVENSPSREYKITDSKLFYITKNLIDETWSVIDEETGKIFEGVGVFAEVIAANIKAGAIETKEFTSNSFIAFQANIDNLIINSNLVSPSIETEIISPIAEGNIIIDLENTATDSAESTYGNLIVKGQEGEDVVSIDSSGNATFSGTLESNEVKTNDLYAGKIFADEIVARNGSFAEITSASQSAITREEIEEMLKEAEENLANLTNYNQNNINSATDSANLNLDELALENLFITDTLAASNLSLSNSLTLGNDLVFQTTKSDDGIILANSIDTLSAPLQIQSLALAPLEIMAGKFRIETDGNVYIDGNLYIAGEVQSEKLTVKANPDKLESGFGNLLDIQGLEGQTLASIDSSGSAKFNEISTNKVIIAGNTEETENEIVSGNITTNATAGKAIIPAGVNEIVISNPNVTNYTLTYVTPTSSTGNNVLYVKAKSDGYFVVGFNETLSIDVSFNWWVIDLKASN